MKSALSLLLALLVAAATASAFEVRTYDVPKGARPHDVAPDPRPGGPVWYTAQGQGALGRLEPATGKTEQIALGEGSAPHGVIIGPDGAPWVTDGGLNAVLRIDPVTHAVKRYPLPVASNVNLNTATFDKEGRLWFTGQSGWTGRVEPAGGKVEAWPAPRGVGPYGIATTQAGEVYVASLAGSYLGHVDRVGGKLMPINPPTPDAGVRRVWSDSHGRLWVSEWFAGKLGRYDPAARSWREWQLPGAAPRPYAVWVDERDVVWLSDFAADAIVRFDPASERFERVPGRASGVRQLLGRAGEVWGAESGADRLIVVRH